MLLSVIVPVYNGEEYLKRCIDSIEKALRALDSLSVSKEFGESEIIIVDDASTDDTPKIIETLKKEYDDIRVINGRDEGVSKARNLGMEASRAEYISFVDADDMVREDIFVRILSALTDRAALMAGCSFFTFDNKTTEAFESGDTIKSYSPMEYIREELLNHNTRCWSKIYKKSLLSDISFSEDLTIGEDMLFLAEVIERLYEDNKEDIIVELKDYEGYGYYQNTRGAMKRSFTPRYMDQISCWERLKELSFISKDQENLKRINVHEVMAIMLVAGKLSCLSSSERKDNRRYIDICRENLQGLINRNPGLLGSLDTGYRIKTELFIKNPDLYLGLYHLWKH